LDQYGYSAVSFELVREIFKQLSSPEVLLTFNVDSLIRYLCDTTSFLKATSGIDLDEKRIQDILNLKNGSGWRYLIQNTLYDHVIGATGAKYYTCFFIKSSASHESYWLLHLSSHPRAKDEMARRHWALSNSFMHHGQTGLNMLGFDPDIDPRQVPMDFVFASSDEERVLRSLERDLPEMIFGNVVQKDSPISFEKLFGGVCNTTPATRDMVARKLIDFRDEKEIVITDSEGKERPRSSRIAWSDRIIIPRQGVLFGRKKK
jgi:hypothetical protein